MAVNLKFLNFFYFLYFVFSIFFCFFLFLVEKKSVVFFFSFLKFSSSWKWTELFFLMDWISLVFMMVLFFMSGSVGFFSMKYMSSDLKKVRFFYILNLFMFSMVVLMISPHYIFFLMGWDGLGFSSFLLISYYNSSKAWTSSLKTFLMKRLGDGLILASFGLILWQGHFFFFFETSKGFLFFLFFLGLLTKSAHFPFSLWLPAAMAAPTPVSALVHSSTLVTAGIYVLFRLVWFVKLDFSIFFLSVALVTVFLGSLKALFSFDSKKVVAFSTLSNLGLLGLSMFLGLVGISFFHLIAHGMSKALLFISVGKIMKKKEHNQDLRKFSKTSFSKMVSMLSSLWSVFSLMGIFFLAGYYSKDYLLEVSKFSFMKVLFYKILMISLIFTFMYSFRLLFFFLKKKIKSMSFYKFYLKFKFMFSFLILFFLSLTMGVNLSYYMTLDVESTVVLKGMVFSLMVLGIFVCFNGNYLFWMMNLKYFSSMFFFPFIFLGKFFQKLLDYGLFNSVNEQVFRIQKIISMYFSSKFMAMWMWELKNFFFLFFFLFMLFFFF